MADGPDAGAHFLVVGSYRDETREPRHIHFLQFLLQPKQTGVSAIARERDGGKERTPDRDRIAFASH